MQHCQEEIYSSDNYCGQCGDEINEKPMFIAASSLVDEQFVALKNKFENAVITTAMVTNTYLYKRSFSHRQGKHTSSGFYSYWYLTLETTEGKQVNISISAESGAGANIKIGDVITYVEPSGLTLHYELAISSDEDVIKTNSVAEHFVIHTPENQKSVDDTYFEPNWSFPSLWFLVVIGLAAYAFFANAPSWLSIETAGAIIGVSFFLELVIGIKKYLSKRAAYKTILDTTAALLNVSYDDLGYHHYQRPKKNSDVICFGCHARIPDSAKCCISCGVSQEQEAPLVNETNNVIENTSPESIESVQEHTALVANADSAVVSKTLSVEDIENYLYEKSKQYSYDYDLVNVIKAPVTSKLTQDCVVAKVVDKTAGTNVEIENIEHARTINRVRRNSYGAEQVISSRREVYATTSYRGSNLSGTLILDDGNQAFTLGVNEYMYSDTHVGDWIVIQYSSIKSKKSNKSFRTGLFNLTQGLSYKSNQVEGTDFEGSEVGLITTLSILLLLLSLPFGFILALPIIFFLIGYYVKYSAVKRENEVNLQTCISQTREALENEVLKNAEVDKMLQVIK